MKIAILAKLSNNVHVICSLIDVIQFDYILMANFLHYVYLRLDVFDIIGIGEYLLVYDLYCYWLT